MNKAQKQTKTNNNTNNSSPTETASAIIDNAKIENVNELLQNCYPNGNDGDEDFQVSRQEMEQIKDAFKKEEFRKMLTDYVSDVRDPTNQLTFQTELRELEKQRGNTVHFLNPIAGYVLKTSNGKKKCFINICSNSLITKPTFETATVDNKVGHIWRVPHSPSLAREDSDKAGHSCLVYDVIFNPEALKQAKQSNLFKQKLEETAIEAIEKNFNVKLDKNNLRRPKLKYKGLKNSTMIKYKIGDQLPNIIDPQQIHKETPPQNDTEVTSPRKTKSKNKKKAEKKENFPTSSSSCSCEGNKHKPVENDLNITECSNVKSVLEEPNKTKPIESTKIEWTEPHYTLKYRNHINIQDFCLDTQRDGKNIKSIPEEIILTIDLPLLRDSSNLEADVLEDGWHFELKHENKFFYKLKLKLPFEVHCIGSQATFDKDKRKLEVTMRTVQKPRETFERSEHKAIINSSSTESDQGLGLSESFDDSDANKPSDRGGGDADNNKIDDMDAVFVNDSQIINGGCFKSSSVDSACGGLLSRSSSCFDYDNDTEDSSAAIPNYGSPNTKKTVRFSDSVQKQVYRSNSSILGQKKKNQRKSKNKRKARERLNSGESISSLSVDDEEDSADGFSFGRKLRERFDSGGSVSSIDEELFLRDPTYNNNGNNSHENSLLEEKLTK